MKEKRKYLYIRLVVMQDGFEHKHDCLVQAEIFKDNREVGLDFAQSYWGEAELVDGYGDTFEVTGSQMWIRLGRVVEIEKDLYDKMFELLYT